MPGIVVLKFTRGFSNIFKSINQIDNIFLEIFPISYLIKNYFFFCEPTSVDLIYDVNMNSGSLSILTYT